MGWLKSIIYIYTYLYIMYRYNSLYISCSDQDYVCCCPRHIEDASIAGRHAFQAHETRWEREGNSGNIMKLIGVIEVLLVANFDGLPSGYDSHSHGESPINGGLQLGKSSINGPFSMAMLNNQRVCFLIFLENKKLSQFPRKYVFPWDSLSKVLEIRSTSGFGECCGGSRVRPHCWHRDHQRSL